VSAKPGAPARIVPPTFERCVVASLGIHLAFFLLGGHLPNWSSEAPPAVEIDLTSPLPGNGGAAKLGAPKRLVPNAPAVAPKPAEEPLPANPVVTPQPPKDWTLPGPNTKTITPPPPTPVTPGGAISGTGTSPLEGGRGPGANYGDPNGRSDGGSPVDVAPPKLLNGDELRRNLRRFYPEAERQAGREGSVLMFVHIGADGSVSQADVKVSAGASFDAAAEQVAKLMRFSPATRAGAPVAVKVTVPIVFQLKD
jgi:protein TonB